MNKFLLGFNYALKGLRYAFRTQVNFKVHTLASVCAIALSYYLKITATEWLWILAVIALVLITELTNTAIETLVDLVSPQYNPKAGIIKDISAAVVLVSALLAFAVGLIIFLPKIIHAA